jgi:hypothetical protein
MSYVRAILAGYRFYWWRCCLPRCLGERLIRREDVVNVIRGVDDSERLNWLFSVARKAWDTDGSTVVSSEPATARLGPT